MIVTSESVGGSLRSTVLSDSGRTLVQIMTGYPHERGQPYAIVPTPGSVVFSPFDSAIFPHSIHHLTPLLLDLHMTCTNVKITYSIPRVTEIEWPEWTISHCEDGYRIHRTGNDTNPESFPHLHLALLEMYEMWPPYRTGLFPISLLCHTLESQCFRSQ